MLEFIVGAIATACTSMLIFYFQEHLKKKNMLNAIRNEVSANLAMCRRLLPVARSVSSPTKLRGGNATVFNLKMLYTNAYEDLRRSGYTSSLSPAARQTLEEVYELIQEHNRQTAPIFYEPIPRTRGYAERLEKITRKLKQLKKLL